MNHQKKIVVTGEQIFINRRRFLFQAMAPYFDSINFIPKRKEWYEARIPRQVIKSIYTLRTGSLSKANALFQKNAKAFMSKSQRAEQEIRQLKYTPDLVFHLFGTYSPFWSKSEIPYVTYLDYTLALAEKNWSGWATFNNNKERESWFECESQGYKGAKGIFCMSHVVKKSLIQDYGIESEKISVVGSSGDFLEPYAGNKNFGSKQLLFNGSDFQRKGGDLVLAAFKQVKKAIPQAKLVILGKKLIVSENGVENPGYISGSELQNIFLNTDLVVAPANCDPFPRFVMEAMNYGIPCIVSAKDGMSEIVDHEVNGIAIEQPTPDMLANHIIHLLSKPAALESLSQGARQKIKTKLNWNNVATQIVNKLS